MVAKSKAVGEVEPPAPEDKDQILALIDRRYENRIALLNYLNYARLRNAVER
jgi:hypothetical protein